MTAIGANMTLHRKVPDELLPTARYGKVPNRWRIRLTRNDTWPPPLERTQSHYAAVQERERAKVGSNNDHSRQIENEQSRASNTRSAHLDLRPPSAYSESIILKREPMPTWSTNHTLDMAKVIDGSTYDIETLLDNNMAFKTSRNFKKPHDFHVHKKIWLKNNHC